MTPQQFAFELPREFEREDWIILTPYGGLEATMRRVMAAAENRRVVSFEIMIYRDKTTARVRIYPDIDMIRKDPVYDTRFIFDRATAVFLLKDGREPQESFAVNAFLRINTQSTAKNDPTGVFTAWYPKEPIVLHDPKGDVR